MRRVFIVACFLFVFLCIAPNTDAQVDEISEVVGLPIPIGSPVIYGQVIIRNIPRGEKRPIIYVYLRNGGAQLDKYQANDRGYWYFLKTPIDGHAITYEIDGNEVGRSIIAGGISNRFRQDVEFDWAGLRGASASKTGTVNARDKYDRSADHEKLFEKAMSAVRAKKADEAIKDLTDLLQTDPKDHVAWMTLGTVYYGEKKNEDARKAYAKEIELKPDYFLANLNLGRLELSEKAIEKALIPLTKAVEVEPNSADANHLLGEALLQARKGSMAVGFLNKAIELDPVGKAELHLRIAALYNAAGYKDMASAEYKKLLEKVKDHPDRKKLEQYIKDNPPKQ